MTAVLGRSLIAVVGKGGVGKTTIAAALAYRCALKGSRVLVLDVEGKNDLAELFGHSRLTANPTELLTDASGGVVLGCTVAPDTALLEYLRDHGLGAFAKRLVSTGALDVIATSTPGIKDLLVLGRIKSYVNEAIADVVIIDTPASGHAVTFLLGPEALAGAVSSGTIKRQADEVRALLSSDGSGVMLVTLPEETPVNETVETAFALEDRVGVSLIAAVVNALVPSVPSIPTADAALLPDALREPLEAALNFERSRVLRQNEQVRVLEQRLPLPQISVARASTQTLALGDLLVIAMEIDRQLELLAQHDVARA